ncbi:hypothetical protein PM022_19415 [Halorubrum ezzemoulense]|uniref:hypothetical protein n=1 Tax=Halorubrum ezzemoulense TaxID=337243 RepID=UPI00232CBC56|nr:hypothetical protein [Halorubrum ezzemoulense]MDB2276647.1 hypothetical protein [Halorubrum ezzemoulense]
MPAYGDQYVVGETYRSSSDLKKDQFQAWLNGPIDDDEAFLEEIGVDPDEVEDAGEPPWE